MLSFFKSKIIEKILILKNFCLIKKVFKLHCDPDQKFISLELKISSFFNPPKFNLLKMHQYLIQNQNLHNPNLQFSCHFIILPNTEKLLKPIAELSPKPKAHNFSFFLIILESYKQTNKQTYNLPSSTFQIPQLYKRCKGLLNL